MLIKNIYMWQDFKNLKYKFLKKIILTVCYWIQGEYKSFKNIN